MNRSTVVVSRRWSGPLIKIDVRTVDENDTEVAVSMSLAEFLNCVCDEIGNPILKVTVAKLRKAVHDAAAEVVNGMKAETTQAM